MCSYNRHMNILCWDIVPTCLLLCQHCIHRWKAKDKVAGKATWFHNNHCKLIPEQGGKSRKRAKLQHNAVQSESISDGPQTKTMVPIPYARIVFIKYKYDNIQLHLSNKLAMKISR